jgi:hypothetical protein
MSKSRSENRLLTELVAVRFTPTDMDALRQEAERRSISVPELLRQSSLSQARAAS